MAYGIRNDYRAQLEPPAYCEGVVPLPGAEIWQPDVYRLARTLARRAGAPALVDLGCGGGDKLVDGAGSRRTIGVDYGENIALCRRRWPERDWRECDFDPCRELPLTAAELDGAVIVCADVVEHLVEPAPFVEALLGTLAHARCVVLSTPDRDRWHGPDHVGPPDNPRHVREWTRAELAGFLTECGAPAGVIGWTRENDTVATYRTILAVAAGSEQALAELGVDVSGERIPGTAFRAGLAPGVLERLEHRRRELAVRARARLRRLAG